jgi:transcriptional regulator GlxA family with amidase domain
VSNLSLRQFSRAFRVETGQSPARAIEILRVEEARAMIELGNHPIDLVARETGFSDPEECGAHSSVFSGSRRRRSSGPRGRQYSGAMPAITVQA